MIGFFVLLVLLMVLIAVCVPLIGGGGGRRVIYEREVRPADDVVEVVDDGYDDVARPVARRRVVRRTRRVY
jgi:alpha-D-ribose 1-methylphosphonate 5-phosphate C-P lyase